MRAVALLLLAAACSVPDKEAGTPDGGDGIDASIDAPVNMDGPPETTITSAPALFTNQGLAVFEFTAGGRTDVTFTCSFDGETPVACSSPFSRALNDGAHAFVVRALASSGESDDTPAEHLWSIDTIAPETMLIAAPPAADNSTIVRFEFESPEENVTFECALDSGAYAPCNSGDEITVGDGAHAYTVRAKDRAGNLDPSPILHAWQVDSSTPDTQLLAAPTGATSLTTASFTFVSEDAGGGATFECSLDAAAFAACTSPRMVSGLTEGEHTFMVRVRDSVGNTDPTPAMRTWRVDRTPPETTISMGPNGTLAAASASFVFSSNELDVTFTCQLDGGAAAPCTSPASYTALPQGPHTFVVHAIDEAGNSDLSPATRAWTVDTVAPDLMITDGPAGGSTVGPRVAIAFTADEGTITCSLDGAAFGACTSPLGTNLAPGPHSFAVRAVDAAGNLSSAMRSWTVLCGAPAPGTAAGLLHLDEDAQVQVNAVAGAPAAMLGDDDTSEPDDPKSGGGKYDRGLDFKENDGDHVSWPMALPASAALAFDAWVRPKGGMPGEVFATNDGRFALALTPVSTMFAFTVTVDGRTVTSAAVPKDIWHHVSISMTSTALSLWVDGVRTGITDLALASPLALDMVHLGAFEGSIDEVWLAASAFPDDNAALANYCPQ